MAIITAANFDYKGPLANFERDSYATLADMVSVNENYLPNVFIGVCEETGKAYLYNKSNTVDPTLGKWREIVGGTDITDYIRKSDDFSTLEPMYDREIVQYIGETTEDYTQGYFYKCISDGAEPATYSWEQIDVQPATDLIWGNIEGDITNQTDLNTELTSLQDQIDSLSGRGRYLTLWDCSTGLAETNPPESPYTYKTGDYFIVGTVAASGGTNYRPDGTSYTTGVASTEVETDEVSIDDTYIYDGSTWHLQYNSQKTVTFTNIEGSPYDNTNLANALNSKLDKVEDSSVVYGTDENGDQTTYALSEFHKGGWHEVSTVSDRDAISDDLLEVGMIVYVTSEAKGYILTSLNTEVTPTLKTWEEYKPGQGDYIRKITTYPISSVSPLVDGEIIQYQGPTVPPYWNGYFYKDEQKYSYISSKSSNMGPASINIIDESLLRNYIYRNQHAISGGWSDIKLVFSGTYAATVYATNGETEVQLNGFNSQEEFEHIGLHVSSSAGYPVSGTIAYIAPAHVWTQTDVQPQTDLIWGNITGTLSDQTDLQDALNVKQDVLTPGNNITIEEDSQTGDLVISSTAQESFFRGKWSNWTSVPTDTSRYPEDYNHNRVPTENDYMVVSDTSDYTAEGMEIKIYWDGWGTHRFSVNDSALVAIGGVNEWVSFNLENDVIIYIKDYEPRYGYFGIKCNVDMLVDGSIVPAGNVVQFIESQASRTLYYYVASGNTLSGTWRFAYHGVWSSIGKNGWLPEYQLEDVLPIATPTEQGIAKLYTNLGSNTDGAVDQATVTTELGKKQDVLTAGTGIDISTDTSTGKLVISSTSYESLFKGKYNTWNDVPTVGANYPLYIDDGVHTHEPTYTDYMVVVDASTVPGGQVPIIITFRINAYGQQGSVKTNIDGTEYNGYGSFDGKVQVRTDVSTGNYGTQFVVLGEDIEYQGTTYHQGQVFLEILHNQVVYGQEYTYNAQLSLGYPYEGTWRFSYRGIWATDNRNGWKGEYPIEQELPIASDTVAGITKLYTTTGSNTDGTMDQNSITTELGDLQDQIDDLKGLGRFLSVWNSSTGLPETNPETSPYEYKSGDYYLVGTVSSSTNYRPDGTSYTKDVPSTVVETEEVHVNDVYIFDGSVWKLQANSQREYTFSGIAGSPYDNTNLSNALNAKQDLLTNASNAGEGIIIDDVTQEISTNNIVWRKW